jgi:L-fuculose-phosphate aldolase
MTTGPTNPPSGDPSTLSRAEEKLLVNIALASRMLSIHGHDDFNQGQVSARLPHSSRFFIKKALCGFNEARPVDAVAAEVDPGRPKDPLAPPELPLHQAIYAARPDVNAIVHSHAPYTLVFGASDLELRPISHEGACFAGQLPRFTETSNTVLEIEVGNAIARCLGSASAVLLCNHGGVITGKSIREATVLSMVLERACRLQLIAEGARVSYRVSSDSDVRAKQDYIYGDVALKSYWDYCVRLVKQTCEDARSW